MTIKEHISQRNNLQIINRDFFSKRKYSTELFSVNSKTIGVKIAEEEKFLHISKISNALFDHISRDTLHVVQAHHPLTSRYLLRIAEAIIDGHFGKELEQKARSLNSNLFTIETPIILLLFYTAHYEKKLTDTAAIPKILISLTKKTYCQQLFEALRAIRNDEVFELLKAFKENKRDKFLSEKISLTISLLKNAFSDIDVDIEEKKSLLELFIIFIQNVASPSHVTIELLEDVETKESFFKRSFKNAMNITKKTERNRSLSEIISNLSDVNQIGEAFKMIRSLAEEEKDRPLSTLVDLLLNGNKFDIDEIITHNHLKDILELVASLHDEEKKEKILQRIIIGLAKHGKAEEALYVCNTYLKDIETKSYMLSSIVHFLAEHRHLKEAKNILNQIKENGAREDATSYIVKAYLDDRNYDEAIAFVDKLADSQEKMHTAKIILSSMIGNHDNEKITEIREHFSLT